MIDRLAKHTKHLADTTLNNVQHPYSARKRIEAQLQDIVENKLLSQDKAMITNGLLEVLSLQFKATDHKTGFRNDYRTAIHIANSPKLKGALVQIGLDYPDLNLLSFAIKERGKECKDLLEHRLDRLHRRQGYRFLGSTNLRIEDPHMEVEK